MCDWTETILADACERVDYGYTASATDASAGPRFLRITDIVSGHLDWDAVPYCEIDESDIPKYRLEDGDIVVARTGASTGCSMHIASPPEAVFASYLVRLRVKDGFDSRFISYCLKTREFQHFITAASSGKSAQPNASAKTITQATIGVPTLPCQKRIAHILGTLDDKIELNRRMNQTLEAIARVIFKSWFVDFDPVHAKAEGREPVGTNPETAALFPDSFQDSPLGKIPMGWEVKTMESLCGRIAMGPFGSNIKTDCFVDDGVPVVRGKNLTDGFADNDFVFVSEEKADELKRSTAMPGDIVITHRGTLGQVGIVPDRPRYSRYIVSQSQMVVSADRKLASPRFLYQYLRSPTGQHELLANRSQTGVPAIARPATSVKAIRLAVPPPDLQAAFDSCLEPGTGRAAANCVEATTLAAMRDALLPRLLSGRIRVSGDSRNGR